jgi:hypothetical protein
MIRPALIFVSATTILCLAACESDQDQKPHPHHQFGYNGDQTVVGPGAESDTTPPPASGVPSSPDNGGPIAPPPPPPPSTAPDQNPAPGDNNPAPPTGANPAPGPNGAPAPAKHDYPYAQPVPGKPGFVTSPYAPYSGYVDVRGFPPGTEVKDPYTQKVFLVP